MTMNRDQVFANVKAFADKINSHVGSMGKFAETACPWCHINGALKFDLDTGDCSCGNCGKNSGLYGLLNEFDFKYVRYDQVKHEEPDANQPTTICPKCKGSGWVIFKKAGGVECARRCGCEKGRIWPKLDTKTIELSIEKQYLENMANLNAEQELLNHISIKDIKYIRVGARDSSLSDSFNSLSEANREKCRRLVMDFYFGGKENAV